MSRCAICDIAPGLSSPTNPYINRYKTPRIIWRTAFNEFQCDDCFEEIISLEHRKEDDGEIEVIEPEDDENTPAMPMREVE